MLARELGHYFGLHHVMDDHDLVYPHQNRVRRCISLVAGGTAAARAREMAMRREPVALSGL